MSISHSFIVEYLSDQKKRPLMLEKSFQLRQFEDAEAEILEYYDQNCTNGIQCDGCDRNIYIEKVITEKHGIANFKKFDELFSRNYF